MKRHLGPTLSASLLATVASIRRLALKSSD
jgi:hypothetical protein